MKRLFVLSAMVVWACSLPAFASLVFFDISVIFDGPGIPTNPAPWLTIAFDDAGSPGTVDLTISALGLDGINEKVAGVYLNLNPALDPGQLAFSNLAKTGSFADPVVSFGVDTYKADGDGFYDILIAFDTDGATLAFNGGESVQYTISLPSLTANSFDFVSTPGGGTGIYKTAVHLLSLGSTDESAWGTVPEPATIILLALGGLLLRKRK